jgi:hypothetical protein
MMALFSRMFVSGATAIAIANRELAAPLVPFYAGKGDQRMITLVGRVEGAPLAVTLTLADLWRRHPTWRRQNADQKLMYEAARLWLQQYLPDLAIRMD